MDTKDQGNGENICVKNSDDPLLGKFDKPLPCFGFGIGWISLLFGLVCPLIWYYATILYFSNCCRKDPRERTGLAASAIAKKGAKAIILSWSCMLSGTVLATILAGKGDQVSPRYASGLAISWILNLGPPTFS